MSTMHNDPKAARIQQLPFFREASKRSLDRLSSSVDEVSVEAGHALISQGHTHAEGFAIEQGVAEVVVDGEVVAEIPPGEMIGEIGMFSRGPATATVRAKTDMTVLVLPYNRIEKIFDENPAMVRAVAQELAERLRAMDAKHH